MNLTAADRAALAFAADTLEGQSTPRWSTPGELAKALDPNTRQTPALDLIDRALVDVAEGRSRRLIVSMPPQEGKSERVTHYGALWMLQRNPDLRIAIVSYNDDISSQFSQKMRNDIITFDGADGNIDLGMRLNRDSKAASRWSIQGHKGGMLAAGIGSALTGRPVDCLFIDDPVKDFRSADSELMSESAWMWWQSVARPRLHPHAPVILILTRWSENDLAGRLIAKQAESEAAGLADYDRWTVVNIPALADYDPDKGETDPLGRAPGEFMESARGRTEAQWRATMAATSPRVWSALYQGRPSPADGTVWLSTWWRRYETPPWRVEGDTRRTIGLDEVFTSWDMTFKDTKSSDFVVGQVWGRKAAQMFLLDQFRDRVSFTATLDAFKRLAARWPDAHTHLVEDKANGSAVLSTLAATVPGLIPVTPHDSKTGRANAVAPFIRAGNVLLPAPGVTTFDPEELITEAAAFPNAAHDDQVDAASQALAYAFVDSSGAAAWLAWISNKIEETQPVEQAFEPGDSTHPPIDPLTEARNQAMREAMKHR